MKKPDPPRGMLKPTLKWPGQTKKVDPKAQAQKKTGLGSNSVTQSQFSLQQLQQMADSRGIPLNTLIAQMVQQYLKEDSTEE